MTDVTDRSESVDSPGFLLGESVVGPTHVAAGVPCQDAFAFKTLALANGEYHLMAVADGLSTCERSDIGARMAIEAFLELAAEFAASIAADVERSSQSSLFNFFQGTFARRLCEVWRTKVEADAEMKNTSGEANKDLKKYGTTITGAVVSPEEAFLGRIGDSDAFAVRRGSSGSLEAIVPFAGTNEKLMGLEVHSLSSRDPQRHWKARRISLRSLEGEDLVMLMLTTDGFSDSFEEPEVVARGIAQDTLKKGRDWLHGCLASSLERFARDGVRDDIAVVLLFPAGAWAAKERRPQDDGAEAMEVKPEEAPTAEASANDVPSSASTTAEELKEQQ